MDSGPRRESVSESFVEVRDEPRHRRRFENTWARVYDVLVAPGDRTLYHRHTEDTLYVSILAARVSDQIFGAQETRTADVPAGICICRPHRAEPLIHRVGNAGAGDMRMIGAEVKASPPLVAEKPLQAPGHELLWETPRLRSYRLALAAGRALPELAYGFSGLTVALTGGCLRLRDAGGSRTLALAPGDALWHEGPLRFELANAGEADFAAIVAEWR